MGRPGRLTVALGLLAAAAVAALGVSWAHHAAAGARGRAARARSADNLRTIGLLLAEEGSGSGRPSPPLAGKRFVLGLVALGRIDRRDPRDLSILFSPGDQARSLEKAGGVAAYASLSRETLQDPQFDATRLTSYAGPSPSSWRASPASPADALGRPLLADLSFGDVAIVWFTGGTVRTLTRAELGLPPHGPMRAGPDSPSPILRALSEE